MRIKKCLLILIAGVLGTMGAAHATDMTSNEARRALTSLAKSKVEPSSLGRLTGRKTNELIVLVKETQANRVRSNPKIKKGTPGFRANLRRSYVSDKNAAFRNMNSSDFRVIRNFRSLPMAMVRTSTRSSLVKLLNNNRVVRVYENTTHEAHLQESLPVIGLRASDIANRRGAGTTVAVLDTGADFGHPDLGACSAAGRPGCRVVAAIDFAPQDNQRDDGTRHGTNVASIVARTAPGAGIAALDVFNGRLAFSADIISAIDWSISNQPLRNIVAMNLSLGDITSNRTECAGSFAVVPFARAREAGIIPVVSSGNGARSTGIASPACAPGAVRVGATYDANVGRVGFSVCTDNSTRTDQITCFSNSAEILTMLAPGGRISAGGVSQFGTSQAAPHVAGTIAMLRAPDFVAIDSLDDTIARMVNSKTVIRDARNAVERPRVDIISASLGRTNPLVAAVLPYSRSVRVGQTATANATIINASNSPARNCRIRQVNPVPARFAVSPARIDIPARGQQNFVISIRPVTAFGSTELKFSFACDNRAPARVNPGVNTLLISASTNPIPDIIALANTPGGDGILSVPLRGAAAFSVATTNVGSTAPLRISADTGSLNLPLNLTVCRTNSVTGACVAAPRREIFETVAANARATYSVFVQGRGVPVSFKPAEHRVFLRFKHVNETRGATSVAVRTIP